MFYSDILVIGTGDKGTKINPDVPKWLIKNKLTNFEILHTVIFKFFNHFRDLKLIFCGIY